MFLECSIHRCRAQRTSCAHNRMITDNESLNPALLLAHDSFPAPRPNIFVRSFPTNDSCPLPSAV